MPSAAQEAYAVAAATRDANGEPDWELLQAEYDRRLAERHQRLANDARAVLRAIDAWGTVKTPEDWQATVRQAADDLLWALAGRDVAGLSRLDGTIEWAHQVMVAWCRR